MLNTFLAQNETSEAFVSYGKVITNRDGITEIVGLGFIGKNGLVRGTRKQIRLTLLVMPRRSMTPLVKAGLRVASDSIAVGEVGAAVNAAGAAAAHASEHYPGVAGAVGGSVGASITSVLSREGTKTPTHVGISVKSPAGGPTTLQPPLPQFKPAGPSSSGHPLAAVKRELTERKETPADFSGKKAPSPLEDFGDYDLTDYIHDPLYVGLILFVFIGALVVRHVYKKFFSEC